eukprot:IDg21473t1
MFNLRKMRINHLSADKNLLFQLAVISMSDKLGLEGLITSSLVFGTYLKRHMSRMRVNCALKHEVSAAVDLYY